MLPLALLLVVLQGGQPVPQPFPKPGGQQPAPVKPGTVMLPEVVTEPAPAEAVLGVPVYPGAQFIKSYDAGRGQRFYLFGTSSSFVDMVRYYRTVLKTGGELVFEAPATHQFDIGRFREETMAFPPSVTIKDYESALSKGYPNPRLGQQPERFPTVIQIVPAVPEGR